MRDDGSFQEARNSVHNSRRATRRDAPQKCEVCCMENRTAVHFFTYVCFLIYLYLLLSQRTTEDNNYIARISPKKSPKEVDLYTYHGWCLLAESAKATSLCQFAAIHIPCPTWGKHQETRELFCLSTNKYRRCKIFQVSTIVYVETRRHPPTLCCSLCLTGRDRRTHRVNIHPIQNDRPMLRKQIDISSCEGQAVLGTRNCFTWWVARCRYTQQNKTCWVILKRIYWYVFYTRLIWITHQCQERVYPVVPRRKIDK